MSRLVTEALYKIDNTPREKLKEELEELVKYENERLSEELVQDYRLAVELMAMEHHYKSNLGKGLNWIGKFLLWIKLVFMPFKQLNRTAYVTLVIASKHLVEYKEKVSLVNKDIPEEILEKIRQAISEKISTTSKD